jgi:hypothetical protein
VDDLDALIDAAITAQLARLTTDFIEPLTARLDDVERANREGRHLLEVAVVREAVSAAVLQAGALPEAVAFLATKAHDDFHVQDGTVRARPERYSPRNPGQPLTVAEWAQDARKTYGYAFNKDAGDRPPNGR